MGSCTKSANAKKKFDIANYSFSSIVNISRGRFLDRLISFIKVIVEYAFGIQIGFGIGWLIGYFLGCSYVKHFKPVYLDDLIQLSQWRLTPYEFAINGAISPHRTLLN